MLMNTTSFLISQLRSTVSATVNSTNHLLTTIKKSLSLVQESNEHSVKHKHLHNQASSTDLGYSNTNDTHLHNGDVTQATPLQHEQYPSLQPWRGLDRRIKNFGLSMPVSANYTAPRHPIVLCHGLFGFDKIGPEGIPHLQIHYWSGIQKALTKLGAKVIVAGVPRTGAIKKRAEDLHRMLSSTMEGMPVNFLAHSMGGLDCRYLISHIQDKNYNVQSLTTLSTPHRGSPFMDWCRDNIGVGLIQQDEQEAMRKLGDAAGAARGSSFGSDAAFYTQSTPPTPSPLDPLWNRLIPLLDTPAYANLTTTYLNEIFNPNTPDDPRVSYYSYGASVPQIPLWAPLGFPWEVIKAKEGPNDGLVSLESARWGQYVETVEADHWDLNNRWRLKIGYNQKPFDAVDLYMNVATRLYKEGY
ncbi:hypothetical protein BGZ74_010327 [Mortierella antarctica]|nr:hypothetical protein BGZ74_010327 [Mortierella antarctica]KAG0357199.1 hypothetical protein BG005_003821 [Podila minutissima]